MTVVGTRPEIIRLSRVIARLEDVCDHTLVHTGQNYDFELGRIFFDDLGLNPPAYYLNTVGANAMERIGAILPAVDGVLGTVAPDAMLVLGDTDSCLAALAAKRRKIPVFHMEAGNRCFDDNVPEEVNRRIVDHIADINLPYSAIAREYLVAEGIAPQRVITTGSPMREVLDYYAPRIDASDVVARIGVERGGYFVASVHRAENVDAPERLRDVVTILDALHARYALPIIVSLHPRTRKAMERVGLEFGSGVRALPPLGFTDYVRLQRDAVCVLSDSGTITEESSILGFPAVNLRETHERPEGMEQGAVMLVGLDPVRALQAVEILLATAGKWPAVTPPPDYSARDVSAKVVRIIVSYTSYVGRYTWYARGQGTTNDRRTVI